MNSEQDVIRFKKINENFSRIKKSVKNINNDVQIVAVTKGRSADDIVNLIKAGAKIIGENKVQEAENKFTTVDNLMGIEKHFIGHLQRNKAKKAVKIFDLIQSVDSIKIATEINKHAAIADKIMPILLQINIANDPNKYGFSKNEIFDSLMKIKKLENIKICGFMTIGRLGADKNAQMASFSDLKKLFDQAREKNLFDVKTAFLSMGMSNDYIQGIKCGSNMVRIGSKLFH